MEPLTLVVGAVVGAALALFVTRRGGGEPASVASAAPPADPPPGPVAPPEAAPPAPPPLPRPEARPEEPPAEVRVVALRCPQCGGDVEPRARATRCAYCDVPIVVEGLRPVPAGTPSSGGRSERPPPFRPPTEATLHEAAFGRFGLTVARQPIHATPRERLRWVPIDERRAGLFLLRVVEPAGRGRDRPPREGPALLDALAEAAQGSLRERRDPGLAAKAALRALVASGQPGGLECFAAVFDAERSAVRTYNAGCPSALVHASTEERRTIEAAPDRHGVLERLKLDDPDAFANGPDVSLSAGDAVAVVSAGVAGDGRGWAHGVRSVHEALRAAWPGGAPATLARQVLDGFWAAREVGWKADEPPCGDLFVAAVTVQSNVELRGPPPTADAPRPRTFETQRFALALAPGPDAYLAWRPLEARRRAAVLVWLEGLPAGRVQALGDGVTEGILEVLGGTTGDNDNPRRATRDGLARAGLDEAPDLRALVLWLGDEHGKAAFFTRGWRPPVDLLPRGLRGRSGQHFDEGGEHFPEPGGRLLFPGALPLREKAPSLAALAATWPGGKASALYAAALHHEDQATAADLFAAAWAAAVTDAPEGPRDGLAVLARRRDED